MYDITLKKGRPTRYDIWFGGEPAPTVEWTRNGRTLTNDKNTSIELYSKNSIYTEKNTVLSIPKADRERDTGEDNCISKIRELNRSTLFYVLYSNSVAT